MKFALFRRHQNFRIKSYKTGKTVITSFASSREYFQSSDQQLQKDEANTKVSLQNRPKEMYYDGNRIREKNKIFLEQMKQYDE
jgi:hypothetical protein